MTNNQATRETTNWVFYKDMVATTAGITIETLNNHTAWVQKAFDHGEPVWMAAEALRVVITQSQIRRSKTPREMAVRIVRAA